MIFYRLYQFCTALFPFITAREKQFISTLLLPTEKDIFNKMPNSDRKHSLKIAFYLAKCYPYDHILLRAALLHDIGKIKRPLNIFEKSLSVLLDNLFPSLADKLSKRENSIMDVYYHHAEKGASLAHDLVLDEEIIYFIKNHHRADIKDERLQKLIQADNLF